MANDSVYFCVTLLFLCFGFFRAVGSTGLDEISDDDKLKMDDNVFPKATGVIMYLKNDSDFEYHVTYKFDDCMVTPIFFHWKMAMTTCACAYAVDGERIPITYDEEFDIDHFYLVPIDKKYYVLQVRSFVPLLRKRTEIVLTIRHPRCQIFDFYFWNNIAIIKTAESLSNQDPRTYLNRPYAEDIITEMRNMVLIKEQKCFVYAADSYQFNIYRCNIFGKSKRPIFPSLNNERDIERGVDKLCFTSSCPWNPGLPVCCGPPEWPLRCFGIVTGTCSDGKGIHMVFNNEFSKYYMGLNAVVANWHDTMIIYKGNEKKYRRLNFHKLDNPSASKTGKSSASALESSTTFAFLISLARIFNLSSLFIVTKLFNDL